MTLYVFTVKPSTAIASNVAGVVANTPGEAEAMVRAVYPESEIALVYSAASEDMPGYKYCDGYYG